MRVGIIGRTGLLLESANEILAKGHQIAFILTCKSEPYYDIKETDFEAFANKLRVPFFNTLDLDSHKEIIKAQGADVCISINWLTILKDPFFINLSFLECLMLTQAICQDIKETLVQIGPYLTLKIKLGLRYIKWLRSLIQVPTC